MKKFLSILPVSIAGSLIVKGFDSGLKSNGCYVLEKDIRDLHIENIEKYKPDVIFGYDFGYLHDTILSDYIIQNKSCFKLAHYFADEPKSIYSNKSKDDLYSKFIETDASSFVWDRDFVNQLPNSVYLPLAVNTRSYKTGFSDAYLYDISFVGRPLTEKRQKILSALVKTFGKRLSVFSYESHFLQSIDEIKDRGLLNEKELEIYKKSYKGYLKNEKELAKVYNSSKVNINITLQGSSSLNYRVFEVPASKGFLITDSVSDLEENFDVGRDLEVYSDIYELIDKIEFYLKHPVITEKIKYNGYSTVCKKHTYTARANTLLQIIKK